MKTLTDMQLDQIVTDIQGACSTLDDVVRSVTDEQYCENDLTEEDHDYLFNHIFLCATCGWWYEIVEMSDSPQSGEDVCNDCGEDEDEW